MTRIGQSSGTSRALALIKKVRDAGALVLPAANAQELNATLSSLLMGKILVESP